MHFFILQPASVSDLHFRPSNIYVSVAMNVSSTFWCQFYKINFYYYLLLTLIIVVFPYFYGVGWGEVL